MACGLFFGAMLGCADERPPECTDLVLLDDAGWDEGWSDLEEAMLAEVNLRRAEGATCDDEVFGPAPALTGHAQARRAARHHSSDMGARNYFAHGSPEGCLAQDRLFAAGWQPELPWRYGENLAGGSETAAAAVALLIQSPPHCKNLMAPAFEYVGIGYAFRAETTYGHYWTQVFGADGGPGATPSR